LKLYFTTPGVTLDITPYAAKDAKDAWQAGRLVQEVSEVKGSDGKNYVVTLTPKGKATKQTSMFSDE
jgi:hypothetical protein